MLIGAEGAYYKQVTPHVIASIQAGVKSGKFETLRDGNFLLFRFEKMILIVQILERGFGYLKIHAKGLELLETTSCHHVEAGELDKLFTEAIGSVENPLGSTHNPKTKVNAFKDSILIPITK